MINRHHAIIRSMGILMGVLLVCVTSYRMDPYYNLSYFSWYEILFRQCIYFGGYVFIMPFFLMNRNKYAAILLMCLYVIVAVAYALTGIGLVFVTPIAIANLLVFHESYKMKQNSAWNDMVMFAGIRKKKPLVFSGAKGRMKNGFKKDLFQFRRK